MDRLNEAVAALDDDVAILMLTEVDFRTGQRHDMDALTARAHARGALAVWDLAHSAGAFPVDLARAGADFAVGCGYKYLNGGPGAPSFVFAARRLHEHLRSPLWGWMGHAAPFEMGLDYRPAAGVARLLCGTPPILSLAALECGIATLADLRAGSGRFDEGRRLLGQVSRRIAAPVLEHHAEAGASAKTRDGRRPEGKNLRFRNLGVKIDIQPVNNLFGGFLPLTPVFEGNENKAGIGGETA